MRGIEFRESGLVFIQICIAFTQRIIHGFLRVSQIHRVLTPAYNAFAIHKILISHFKSSFPERFMRINPTSVGKLQDHVGQLQCFVRINPTRVGKLLDLQGVHTTNNIVIT